MSTSTVIPSNDTITDIAIKPELVTFAVLHETVTSKDANGNDVHKVTLRHTSSEKEISKIKESDPDSILFEQSVTAYKVGSLAGLAELVPDAEEQLNIVNRGLAQKFNQKAKQFLTEQEDNGNPVFQPVAGAYDSKEWLQTPTVRRNLSDTEKAMKFVSNLDPATLAIIEQMLAAQKAAASSEAAG